MAQATVVGVVLWAKHIHGDGLAERVAALPGGRVLRLVVDGLPGDWRKMDDGRDGRPTPGLRPLGHAKAAWLDLYARRRGALVVVEAQGEAREAAPGVDPAGGRTPVERRAALEALLSIRGRSPEGWSFSRQDVYDDRVDELTSRHRGGR